jgi:MSHA biogenesis protein MshI
VDWLTRIIKRKNQRVGLRWEDNLLSLCVLNISGNNRQFTVVERIALNETDAAKVLAEKVNQLGIKHAEAYWVLPTEQYRLLTLERPAVPDTELASAIRWQIKDLIDFDLEQAVVDHFPYPKGLPGSHQLYAVVTHRQTIERLVELTRAVGLELKAIDISELTLGNIIKPQLQEGQNVAFIGEHPGGLSVNCYYGEEFVFTRWLPDVYLPRTETDDELTLDLDIDRQSDNDRLLLEIQRTLDYYEGQISRQAVTRLLIPALGQSSQGIVELLRNNLGLPVDVLNLQHFCHWSESVDELSMHTNLSVVGAVLRGEDLSEGLDPTGTDETEVADATN